MPKIYTAKASRRHAAVTTSKRPDLTVFTPLLFLWIFVLSVVVAWSPTVCEFQSAEDFAQFLLGLNAPSLFYPGSNRMGNLIPLLGLPIRNILWNGNLQLVLRSLSSFGAIYFACRVLARREGVGGRTCAIAFVSFLTTLVVALQFTPVSFVALWASPHTYLLATAIMFASIAPLQHSTSLKALLLAVTGLLVAFWINLAVYTIILLFLGSSLVLIVTHFRSRNRQERWRSKIRMLFRLPLRSLWMTGIAASVAFVFANITSAWYAERFPNLSRSFATPTYVGIHPSAGAALDAYHHLAAQTGGFALISEFTICLVLIAGRFHLLGLRLPKKFAPLMDRRTELAVLSGAVGYLLLTSQSTHAQAGNLNFPYFMLASIALVFLLCSLFYGLFQWAMTLFDSRSAILIRRLTAVVLLPGLALGLVAKRFGIPSGACLFRGPGEIYDMYGRVIATGGYSAIIGSYWDAWPAAFGAAVVQAKNNPPIFPTTYRAELVEDQIRDRIRSDFLTDGAARLLCIVPSADRPEHSDCIGLVKWSQQWGTLPGLGEIRESETKLPLGNLHEMICRPAVLAPGQTVDFRTGGNGQIYEFEGWWPPEPFGSWTIGPKAELFFQITTMPREDMLLDFQTPVDIGKLVRPSRLITVDVRMNGHHIRAWTFNPDTGDRELRVPRAYLRLGGANFLSLSIFSPHSGRELGFSPSDTRSLGIAVSSLHWK